MAKKKKVNVERKAYQHQKKTTDRLTSLANKRKKNGDPVWDLDRDGVTYTLLSRFMVCPERFRLATVEGWSETGLQAALEFGSAFHRCLENPDKDPCLVTQQYQRERRASGHVFQGQAQEFEVLMAMVEACAYGYRTRYKDVDNNRVSIMREVVWDIQYPLRLPEAISFSNGDLNPGDPWQGYTQTDATAIRHVRLRGRFDEVFRDKRSGKVWLLETKTKSDIDEDGISRTLPQDLQTMLYVTAIEHQLKEPVEGVIYNVIRRPQLRLGKSEDIVGFTARVKETVSEQLDRYFYRWRHEFVPGEVATWQERSLNPLLTQLVLWWDSIKSDPFDPWGSPLHYQRPFGVYDSLASGRRGDFFELVTGGNVGKLRKRTTAFPELEGE